MEEYGLSRKERRMSEKKNLKSEQLRKNTALLGSAIVVSSLIAPVAIPNIAEANEESSTSEQVEHTTTPTYTDVDSEHSTSASDALTHEEMQDSSEVNTSESAAIVETDTTQNEDGSEVEIKSSVSLSSAPVAILSGDTSSFINDISSHAQSVAAANDLYASIMIAQAILESDWGRSALASSPNYNLFGIKGSYQGQSATMQTWEVINGQWVQVSAAFRKYPSYSESFIDNAYVLKNTSFQAGSYYYSGAWKSNTSSYQEATAWLTGRYATDPSYNIKLNNIIVSYNLTQYDTSNASTGNTTTPPSSTTGTTDLGTAVMHTVQSGDSLWALASKYNTTITNIKNWNNLSSDIIYVGQQLVVGQQTTTGSGAVNEDSTSSPNNNETTTSNSTSTMYTVKSGDSLWAIANANGVSVSNLREWNTISGDMIYPGQQLIVKKGSPTTSASGSTTTTGSSTTAGSGTSYTVKSGDSLWAIANANGISISNLREWNAISGDMIYPGQQLIVKKGSSTTSASGSTTTTGSSTTAGSSTSYTVKSGDSLWAIANANGVSISELRNWNSIRGDIIHPGQNLIVKKGTTSANNASNPNVQTTATYKVVSGDTLWDLAETYNTSVQVIKQLNGLSTDTIYIGQTLKVK